METSTNNKTTIRAAVLASVASIALTYFVSSWSRFGDSPSRKEITEQIDKKSDQILLQSKQYTDTKFEVATETYHITLEHIEALIKANDEKFNVVMEALNNRLDRLDQRLNEKE
jgi:hypothetical protein